MPGMTAIQHSHPVTLIILLEVCNDSYHHLIPEIIKLQWHTKVSFTKQGDGFL